MKKAQKKNMRKDILEKSRKYPADANKKCQKHEPTGNRFSPQRRTDGRSVSSIPGSCRITELSETSYTVTKKNIEKKKSEKERLQTVFRLLNVFKHILFYCISRWNNNLIIIHT